MRFKLLAGICFPIAALVPVSAYAQDAGGECSWEEVASDNFDNPGEMIQGGGTPTPTPSATGTGQTQSGTGFGTPTPTPTSTDAPTPQPSMVPSPVVQPLPTETPVPDPTPTPAPTPTATSGGGGGGSPASSALRVNTSGRTGAGQVDPTRINGEDVRRVMYKGIVTDGYAADLSERRPYTPGAGQGTIITMGGYKVRASGVSNSNITQNVAKTLDEVHIIFKELGASGPVITSGRRPNSAGSFHQSGNAYDIRCNDKPDAVCKKLAGAIASALGNNYDVFFEDHPAPYDAYDHIHVEYDP